MACMIWEEDAPQYASRRNAPQAVDYEAVWVIARFFSYAAAWTLLEAR